MYTTQVLAKLISSLSKLLGRGGETWPGEIAMRIDPSLSKELRGRFARVILVAGTNGKTSTAKFVTETLIKAGETVITNRTGANLLNGLVSSSLVKLPLKASSKLPVAVFEVDEYALPEINAYFRPEIVLFLNIFRDQLDRYGEVNNILDRWKAALSKSGQTKVIYLSSDPALYYAFATLKNLKIPFAIPQGLLTTELNGVLGDLVYCPVCEDKLKYRAVYLSHLGDWNCPICHISQTKSAFQFKENAISRLNKLPGYTQINLTGVYLLLKELGYSERFFWEALNDWQPAFGRGEKYQKEGKEFEFYLGKNPASWTVALDHLRKQDFKDRTLVLGLNNRVPDGHDISWIYDADCQVTSKQFKRIVYFGDRGYDLALRFKLAGQPIGEVFPDISALEQFIKGSKSVKFTILANYSALLESRRVITGKALI